MKRYRKVHVVWMDAATNHGWESAEEAVDGGAAHECESVGYLLRQTKEEIVLVQTIGGSDVNGRITIPRPWIRGRITTLK